MRPRFRYTPGQFCELSIFGQGEAPFGIASSPTEEGFVRFTVKKAGVVTTKLHSLKPGDVIGMRGPLGNDFPLDLMRGKDVVVIGGGFAFTTLRSLIIYLLEGGEREQYGKITVIYGARTPGLLMYQTRPDGLGSSARDIQMVQTIDMAVPGWTRKVGFVPNVTEETAPSAANSVARHLRAAGDDSLHPAGDDQAGLPEGADLYLAGEPHEVRHRQVRALQRGRQVRLSGWAGV